MGRLLAFGGTLALGIPLAGVVASTMPVLGFAFFVWRAVPLYLIPL